MTVQKEQESPDVLHLSAARWPAGTVELTYSFADTSSSSTDADRDSRLGNVLEDYYRGIVREAMDAWEEACGVRFIEVADSPDSDIRMGWMPWTDSDGPLNTLGVVSRWWDSGTVGQGSQDIDRV